MFSDKGILKDIVVNSYQKTWYNAMDELVKVLQDEIASYINKEIMKRMTIPKERMESLVIERCSVQKEF